MVNVLKHRVELEQWGKLASVFVNWRGRKREEKRREEKRKEKKRKEKKRKEKKRRTKEKRIVVTAGQQEQITAIRKL